MRRDGSCVNFRIVCHSWFLLEKSALDCLSFLFARACVCQTRRWDFSVGSYRWNQRTSGDALIKDLKPLLYTGTPRSSIILDRWATHIHTPLYSRTYTFVLTSSRCLFVPAEENYIAYCAIYFVFLHRFATGPLATAAETQWCYTACVIENAAADAAVLSRRARARKLLITSFTQPSPPSEHRRVCEHSAATREPILQFESFGVVCKCCSTASVHCGDAQAYAGKIHLSLNTVQSIIQNAACAIRLHLYLCLALFFTTFYQRIYLVIYLSIWFYFLVLNLFTLQAKLAAVKCPCLLYKCVDGSWFWLFFCRKYIC